jgi:signal transduction histidine kinase
MDGDGAAAVATAAVVGGATTGGAERSAAHEASTTTAQAQAEDRVECRSIPLPTTEGARAWTPSDSALRSHGPRSLFRARTVALPLPWGSIVAIRSKAVPKLSEAKLLYAFVGAFVAATVAFLVASVVTAAASKDIDRSVADLLSNSLPSVSALNRARNAAHRIEMDAEEIPSAPRSVRTHMLLDIQQSSNDLREAMGEEVATPRYPGEQELLNARVTSQVARLDTTIGDLTAALAATPIDGAVARTADQVVTTARAVGSGLQAAMDLNHRQSYEAAERIVSARLRAGRITVVLQVASALVAALCAAAAIAAARRFTRLASKHIEHEASRAHELDLVAQRVAHDLTSPLATVSLCLGILRRAHGDPATVTAVDRALGALGRSSRMVRSIYRFAESGAQPVPGATAPLRSAVVEAANDVLAAQEGPPVALEVKPFEDVAVACDRAALGVMITNLVSNAVKFTRNSPARRITIRGSVGAARARVEVEDTGPGVPPGFEACVFEPYRRAPGVTQPGLGLGLATVKRLVVAHGGTVGLSPAPSGGAIFWFELPRAPVAKAAEAETARAPLRPSVPQRG